MYILYISLSFILLLDMLFTLPMDCNRLDLISACVVYSLLAWSRVFVFEVPASDALFRKGICTDSILVQ